MRNESSDSHGVEDRRINLKEHHARLFVNAAMTMADFILSVEKTVKMHSKSKKESDKMTAVIYARYSSDNQREESIEGQLRECKAFAEKNDIQIVGTYIDRAFSARTDNRPDFQKMIKDSASKKFELIIVWKLTDWRVIVTILHITKLHSVKRR